jgi:large subunit ribosomal protein L6
MSRIGNKPVSIPEGVGITVEGGSVVVKGPKGELAEKVDPDFVTEISDGQLTIKRPTEQKRHKALHGLYRSLINNMVEGVSTGYKKDLELVGVGYKASTSGNVLEMSLGSSLQRAQLVACQYFQVTQ